MSTFKYCLPAGIGDNLWILSRIYSLPRILNKEIAIYLAQDHPRRGGAFIEMWPEGFEFAGYLDGYGSWDVLMHSIPSDWATHHELAPLLAEPNKIKFLNANIHLEQGRRIETYLPLLPPTNFHPTLNIQSDELEEGYRLADVKNPVSIYVSNRDKDKLKGGWSLWNEQDWVIFLRKFRELYDCTYIFMAAEYDRDKTEAVISLMKNDRCVACIDKPLGVALSALSRCHYSFSYPSGIGILSSTLNVPGVMLLPTVLPGLESSWIDPVQVANETFKCFVNPTVDEVLEHMRKQLNK